MIYPRVRDHVAVRRAGRARQRRARRGRERYDPARGVTFATFAWYRVQGAIIDGLRKATHLPRRTWAKLVALRAASEYLENRAERDAGATQRGAAPATGADALAAVKQAMSAIRTMYVTSLETMRDRGFDIADGAPGAGQPARHVAPGSAPAQGDREPPRARSAR